LKIGIIPNSIKDKNFEYTKKAIKKIGEVSEVFVCSDESLNFDGVNILGKDDFYSECDIVITLGGDGTLLRAAHDAALFGKPILGINLGRLGFLTGSESNYFLEEGYKKLAGNFEVQERMMIEAEIIRENGKMKKIIALNDIVVKRAEYARMDSIDIFVDKELLGTYLADGIIVSTPTGTTAYSLSAGGPIADPSLDAMIITPICPHLLRARPMVIPSHKAITVEKPNAVEDISAVSADGQEGFMAYGGDKITIKKSNYKTRLVKIEENGFYNLLARKLR